MSCPWVLMMGCAVSWQVRCRLLFVDMGRRAWQVAQVSVILDQLHRLIRNYWLVHGEPERGDKYVSMSRLIYSQVSQ